MRDRRALAVLAPAALALAACGAGGASSGAGGPGAITVAADDTSCAVGAASLASGTSRFTVTNTGSKATEFEVLGDGGRILGEVENIAPGVPRTLIVDLPAGRYEAVCKPGMVGDGIRSALTVTGPSATGTEDQQLRAAVTAYEGYVRDQVASLRQQTAAFAAAVEAGDAVEAKALYAATRTPYERIEPVAESLGDLDPQIDARENDVEQGQAWTGFHVLEKTLWGGGDLAAAGPVAADLRARVDELAAKVQTLDLAPLDLANGALGLLDEIATSKVTGEEERYSHTDLWDFSANLDGSLQAVQQLRPVVAERDPALATALDQRFAATRAALDAHRQGGGYRSYTDLTAEQTRALSDSVTALAAQVSRVPATVAGK